MLPVGLLRTVLVILIFIFLLRIIFRVILPFFLGFFVKGMQQQPRQTTRQHTSKKEGTITVEKTSNAPKKRTIKKDIGGDYIDFEEVKEEK